MLYYDPRIELLSQVSELRKTLETRMGSHDDIDSAHLDTSLPDLQPGRIRRKKRGGMSSAADCLFDDDYKAPTVVQGSESHHGDEALDVNVLEVESHHVQKKHAVTPSVGNDGKRGNDGESTAAHALNYSDFGDEVVVVSGDEEAEGDGSEAGSQSGSDEDCGPGLPMMLSSQGRVEGLGIDLAQSLELGSCSDSDASEADEIEDLDAYRAKLQSSHGSR